MHILPDNVNPKNNARTKYLFMISLFPHTHEVSNPTLTFPCLDWVVFINPESKTFLSLKATIRLVSEDGWNLHYNRECLGQTEPRIWARCTNPGADESGYLCLLFIFHNLRVWNERGMFSLWLAMCPHWHQDTRAGLQWAKPITYPDREIKSI